MDMKLKRRANITLMEVMITLFILSCLAGVLGYSMRGALDKGKAASTQLAIGKLEDILLYEWESGNCSKEDIENNPEKVLENSALIRNTKNMTSDSWGEPFKIEVKSKGKNSTVVVSSERLNKYNKRFEKA